ncbi:MAG: ABC transporter ATP-binding protein [Candidatus Thermoplasmatota archaeon]|nr:ABC transporter ATP-binding protein [Candidatus Thermoplasmatota archaeon]
MSKPYHSVEVSNVSKSYGDVVALSHATLKIGTGQIFGVIGPNGSGKSTMLKLIASVLQPDSGDVRVLGLDCRTDYLEVRKAVGFVPEDSVMYQSLTSREFLSLISSIYDIGDDTFNKRLEALSQALDCTSVLDELIGSLSFGNKQKISIISALIHDPELIVLDEPTKGLDPRSFRIFKDMLAMMASNGKTIILSTHVMEIAEELCQRVCIIYKGEILAEDAVSALLSRGGARRSLERAFLDLTGESGLENIPQRVWEAFR